MINHRSLFLIFLVIGLLFVSSASATVTLYPATPRIEIDGETLSITELRANIVAQENESVADTYLEEVSPGIWLMKAQMYNTNDGDTYFTFNSTDGTELRLGYVYISPGSAIMKSRVDFSDVTVRTWNITSDEAEAPGNRLQAYYSNSTFENVRWDSLSTLYMGSDSFGNADYITILNSSITDWYTVFEGQGEHWYIDGFQMVDSNPTWTAERACFDSMACNYSTFKNIYINPFRTFSAPVVESTSSYGFQMSGNHNYYENITVENATYSGYNLAGTYNTFESITARNNPHNQIEAMCDNSVFRNITITGGNDTSNYDAAWFTSSSYDRNNVTVEKFSFDHIGTGSAIRMSADGSGTMNNWTFRDGTILSHGISVGGVTNFLFENVTVDTDIRNYLKVYYANGHYPDNIVFTNCSLHGENVPYYTFLGSKIRMVNTDYDDTQAGSSNYSIIQYQPLNVWVHNETGFSVEAATISTESGIPSVNQYGINTTTATTNTNGNISIGEMLYVPDVSKGTAGTVYYTINATASKDGDNATITGINPSTSWRSVDLSALQGDLQVFELDVLGSGDEPSVEYWTPTEGHSYIDIPETWTWTDGSFVHNYTYGQILPEDAPERAYVEVHP